MKKKPIVYKVVAKDGKSAFTHEGLKLEYKIGRITRPKIGLLFAFDSVENVIEYFGDFVKVLKIYECKAEIAEMHPVVIPCSSARAEEFWVDNSEDMLLMVPPKGTVFCKSITPKRLVRDWENAK